MTMYLVKLGSDYRIATYNDGVANYLSAVWNSKVETVEDHYACGDYDEIVFDYDTSQIPDRIRMLLDELDLDKAELFLEENPSLERNLRWMKDDSKRWAEFRDCIDKLEEMASA